VGEYVAAFFEDPFTHVNGSFFLIEIRYVKK